MTENQTDEVGRVVGYVLNLRDSADRGGIARVRTGLNAETEHRAYGDILPLLDPTTRKSDEQAYLRAAALVAWHPQITQLEEKRAPIGVTFRRFSINLAKERGDQTPFEVDPATPDGIAVRLTQLPEQDLNTATLTLNRILDIGDGMGIQIDYFALARTVLRWGNGTSEASQAIRRTPLRDYYRPLSTSASKKDDK